MGDAELDAIRQRRMQELMAANGGAAGGQGGQPMTAEQQQEQAAQAQEADQQRAAMLHVIMEPAARERLSRIALVKSEKARGIEDILLNAAKRGQLGQKVTEDRLIELLGQVNEQTSQRTKVTIQRRQRADDDW